MQKHRCSCLLFALFLVTVVSHADSTTQSDSQALILRARQQQDIFADETPPLLMRALVQVADAKGVLVTGDYILNFASPSKWREEIRFVNYGRVRVRDANGYWQKSELNYKPEFMFQLDTLLHMTEALKIGATETLEKVKNREKGGLLQKCTVVKRNGRTARKLCFADQTGTLIRVEYPTPGDGPEELDLMHRHPPEVSRIEYTAFHPIGRKLVPFEVLALDEGKLVVGVKVQQVTKIVEEDPAIFKPPANSEFWARCDDMLQPELLNHVNPLYPPSARANYESGRVILYGVIETDGSVSHLAVIQPATRALDAAAAQGVSQWRYKPARCGQTPIRTEISIPIDFSLQH